MTELFVQHADICKTFAHPKRLEIINALRDERELAASQLLKILDISKANLSQHMAILAQKGVVKSKRVGVNVFYRLSDGRISKACDIMREVLISRLKKEAKVLRNL